jgi:hypothetical protein
MIEIVEVSPGNELPVAKRLKNLIEAAWPGVASSKDDRVTILVGVREFREIDLLVFVELATPRVLPPLRRRDGSTSPISEVQAAVLVVEVKQLDGSRFTVQGPQIFANYGGGKGGRSVNAQIDDCVVSLRNYKGRYGISDFFVHGIGWLTAVAAELLAGVSPWIVGADAGWFAMLDAAAQRSPALYGPKAPDVIRALATVRESLVLKRVLTPRDRNRTNALCHDVIASELVESLATLAGKKQIRLTGRGGSGKTTTLALLAKRLASIEGERVLILTYHKALRGDIAHLIETLLDVPGVASRIRVETALSFFTDVLQALDVALERAAGRFDFKAVDAALSETAVRVAKDPELVLLLKEAEPRRFACDYVFIDEAQDWSDAERDLIRAMYGSENLVLADGLEQLVRRQTPCDWNAGIAKAARHTQHLGRSLRMTANLATFANAFANVIGLRDWVIHPVEELPGGRIVVVAGNDVATGPFFAAVRELLAAGGAAPLDALVCVPPAMVRDAAGGGRESTCGAALRAAGAPVWDASDERVRDKVPTDADAWRIVQYDSCRGLEGWIAIAFGLDQFFSNKLKYPNLAPGDLDTAENVARRWLMTALTRAVHTLVITIADPQAPLVNMLRAAAATMPPDVVEWTTAADSPDLLLQTVHEAAN